MEKGFQNKEDIQCGEHIQFFQSYFIVVFLFLCILTIKYTKIVLNNSAVCTKVTRKIVYYTNKKFFLWLEQHYIIEIEKVL